MLNSWSSCCISQVLTSCLVPFFPLWVSVFVSSLSGSCFCFWFIYLFACLFVIFKSPAWFAFKKSQFFYILPTEKLESRKKCWSSLSHCCVSLGYDSLATTDFCPSCCAAHVNYCGCSVLRVIGPLHNNPLKCCCIGPLSTQGNWYLGRSVQNLPQILDLLFNIVRTSSSKQGLDPEHWHTHLIPWPSLSWLVQLLC